MVIVLTSSNQLFTLRITLLVILDHSHQGSIGLSYNLPVVMLYVEDAKLFIITNNMYCPIQQPACLPEEEKVQRIQVPQDHLQRACTECQFFYDQVKKACDVWKE